MLKNQRERSEYLNDKSNWEVVNNYDDKFRILKLKGVNLYTIEAYRINTYTGNVWGNISGTSQYFTAEEKDGVEGIKVYITRADALRIIKETDVD